jgi:hypothetical protein
MSEWPHWSSFAVHVIITSPTATFSPTYCLGSWTCGHSRTLAVPVHMTCWTKPVHAVYWGDVLVDMLAGVYSVGWRRAVDRVSTKTFLHVPSHDYNCSV